MRAWVVGPVMLEDVIERCLRRRMVAWKSGWVIAVSF